MVWVRPMSIATLRLPIAGGALAPYTPTHRFLYGEGGEPPRTRVPYAAVHHGVGQLRQQLLQVWAG